MTADACASGNPRFQQLDPAQFAPRGPVVRTGKAVGRTMEWKVCHKCDQETMVKLDGFFYMHKSSIKGNVRASETTASGKPARTRGRRG